MNLSGPRAVSIVLHIDHREGEQNPQTIMDRSCGLHKLDQSPRRIFHNDTNIHTYLMKTAALISFPKRQRDNLSTIEKTTETLNTLLDRTPVFGKNRLPNIRIETKPDYGKYVILKRQTEGSFVNAASPTELEATL